MAYTNYDFYVNKYSGYVVPNSNLTGCRRGQRLVRYDYVLSIF